MASWFAGPHEKGPDSVARQDPAAPLPAVPADRGAEGNRAAAEWLLRLGGQGKIFWGAKKRPVFTEKDLPTQPFEMLVINLFENKQVTDADLARLPPLTTLVELNLGRTSVTDNGVRALPQLPALKTLHLAETGVTDAGLEAIGQFPALTSVNLDKTGVTGAGLAT